MPGFFPDNFIDEEKLYIELQSWNLLALKYSGSLKNNLVTYVLYSLLFAHDNPMINDFFKTELKMTKILKTRGVLEHFYIWQKSQVPKCCQIETNKILKNVANP